MKINTKTKKIIFAIASILCVVAIGISAYFLFFCDSSSSDYNTLLDVYIPKDSPVETADDTDSGFISSMSIYSLNADEKQKVESDISSNKNWKKYTEADREIITSLNLIILTSDFEPDLENCYIAFHNYSEGTSDLPLSAKPQADGNAITFSARLISLYDETNGKYYLIDCIA